MKCPHCLENFYVGERTTWGYGGPSEKGIMHLGSDPDGHWWIETVQCPNPACGRVVLSIINCEGTQRDPKYPQSSFLMPAGDERIVHVRPKATNRPPIPVEVPDDFAEDYREACLVQSGRQGWAVAHLPDPRTEVEAPGRPPHDGVTLPLRRD